MIKKFNHMGSLIFALRKKHKLTQSEFRDLIDPTKKVQWISNMERGVASMPVKYHKTIVEKLNEDVELFKEAYILDTNSNYDKGVM